MSVDEAKGAHFGTFDGEQDISAEEKRQILDAIEKSVSSAAIPDAPELPPRKKSLLFPLAINLIGVLVAVAVIVGSLFLFRVRREQLESSTAELASAEGKILAEFKREAEEKIKEKDMAIVRVLKQLGALEREREQLARIMELRIQDKEREMRQSLEEELATARGKLAEAGLKAEEIDERLLEYESSRKREMFEILRAFQAEIDALTYEKERELVREKARARLALEQATVEREELLVETNKQETILVDQLQREEGTSSTGWGAEATLAEQESMGVQERLIIDQIVSTFLTVGNQAVSGRYEAAARGLDSLEAILRDEKVSSLPAVERRKASDLKIIEAFRSLLAASTDQPGSVTTERKRSAPAGTAERAGVEREQIERLQGELRQREAELSRLQAVSRSAAAERSAERAAAREQIETLRRELRRREAELSRLQEASTAAAAASGVVDPETAAEEARTAAFRDLLSAMNSLDGGRAGAKVDTLRYELARTPVQESLVERILLQIDDLNARASFAAAGSGLSYRILGTVTAVGAERLTILPIVNLPVGAGAPVEIRRILESGTTLRIARGNVVEVQGEKLIARIETLAGSDRPMITDKVYLIED